MGGGGLSSQALSKSLPPRAHGQTPTRLSSRLNPGWSSGDRLHCDAAGTRHRAWHTAEAASGCLLTSGNQGRRGPGHKRRPCGWGRGRDSSGQAAASCLNSLRTNTSEWSAGIRFPRQQNSAAGGAGKSNPHAAELLRDFPRLVAHSSQSPRLSSPPICQTRHPPLPRDLRMANASSTRMAAFLREHLSVLSFCSLNGKVWGLLVQKNNS